MEPDENEPEQTNRVGGGRGGQTTNRTIPHSLLFCPSVIEMGRRQDLLTLAPFDSVGNTKSGFGSPTEERRRQTRKRRKAEE